MLNVFQSVKFKYPSVVALAKLIEILGVTPPEDAIGKVPVTEVTVPLPVPGV